MPSYVLLGKHAWRDKDGNFHIANIGDRIDLSSDEAARLLARNGSLHKRVRQVASEPETEATLSGKTAAKKAKGAAPVAPAAPLSIVAMDEPAALSWIELCDDAAALQMEYERETATGRKRRQAVIDALEGRMIAMGIAEKADDDDTATDPTGA